MSRAVFQPVGQKRLTNIAVVRLKKQGNRFEIACYKNKVGDWRSGIEKDLDEVLQTTAIFSNVGKGVLAKKEDLMAAFGTTEDRKICLEILAKGELQVSDKERKVELDNLFKDVASVLVDKTINPDTQRPYTITMLERALRDVHFNVDIKKSAKQQALEALPVLQQKLPIQRARMRLRAQAPAAHQQVLLDYLAQKDDVSIELVEEAGSSVCIQMQADPGAFRDLHSMVHTLTDRAGRLEVLSMAVTTEEGSTAEDFAASAALAARSAALAAPLPAASAPAAVVASRVPVSRPAARQAAGGGSAADVVYAQGAIADVPEQYAARKERFAELDTLQPGWTVELRSRGDTVDAVFFAPSGEKVGAFAQARRMALQWHKANVG